LFLTLPPAAEKSVAEYKDKLPQNVVDSINAAVSELRGVMESENSEEIKGKITAVQQAVMKIGESLAGKGGAEGGAAAGGENVEDAEVKDKENK
jgi:molecular chaperone DnaK (HSP70)